MKERYPVEDLLRPPYELYSTLVSMFNVSLFLFAGPYIGLPEHVTYPLAIVFTLWGISNAWEGIHILRYRRGLRRLSLYKKSTKNLNVNPKYTFLGRGFLWTEKHTQRLVSCARTVKEKYVTPSVFERFSISLDHRVKREWILNLFRIPFPGNPFVLPPDLGGNSNIHGVGALQEENIYLKVSDRKTHFITVGQSGVGKTRRAEMNVAQDIHRKGENVVISIEPKGDADFFLRNYTEAKASGRLGSFRIFHMAHPGISCCYNPLGNFVRITEVASKSVISVSDGGDNKAFKDFAWDFINNIAAALFFLGKIPDYNIVKRYYRNIDKLFVAYAKKYFKVNKITIPKLEINIPNNAKKDKDGLYYSSVIKALDLYDPILDNLMGMFDMDREYYGKISNSILPFLTKVTTGKLSEVLNPSLCKSPRAVLDWQDVIRQNSVVYFGLDAMTDPEIARVVGESAYADLASLSGYLYHHGIGGDTPYSKRIHYKDIFIHADELSDLLGDRFIPLINKSRGAGFHLHMYTQTLSDLSAALGSEQKADQILGSIGSMEFMRVQDVKAANYFISKLPTVRVKQLTDVSSARQGGDGGILDFASDNEDRITDESTSMLEVAHIVSLPIGQSFVLMNGNKLYKIRIPQPDKADLKDVPEDVMAVAREMKESYQSEFQWEKVA